jgi:hypothetical protein
MPVVVVEVLLLLLLQAETVDATGIELKRT